jgi:dipeptidyl aminopeptidase/acylaminoacyl peptidase
VIAQSKLADISGVLMTPREHKILATSYNYQRTIWEILDPAVRPDFDTLRQVTRGDVEIVSQSLDDRHWIVAYLLDDGPVRYYHYDRDSRTARFLFTNRHDLEQLPLVRMHPLVIKSRDGLNLVCYLSLPRNAAADDSIQPRQPLAMVMIVHGGPWARDTWGFNPEHQLWANRGYAVLSVNFRGSTGLGKEFLNAGNREWAGKMHDDLVDAVHWAVDQKIADPRRVAIAGGSYGGYATLVGLTFTPDLFACGVDIVGPSNILTLLNTIPPYWKPIIQMFRTRVGDYTTEAGRKFLEERSPLSFVERIRRPLLIGQGANDPRVKQTESDQIVKAMLSRNIPVTYVLFPDEGHGFVRPANRLAFYAVMEAFLAEHLGGRYQAIGNAFEGSTIRVPTGAQQVPGLPAALESMGKPQ